MKPFERMNRDTMEANAILSSSIIEDINGIETIKPLTSGNSRYQKIDRIVLARASMILLASVKRETISPVLRVAKKTLEDGIHV